jgi:hypothetical protein
MQGKKRIVFIWVLFLLVVTVLPVAAAPAASEAVNLPGSVGIALSVLALILAFAMSFWMRNQKK